MPQQRVGTIWKWIHTGYVHVALALCRLHAHKLLHNPQGVLPQIPVNKFTLSDNLNSALQDMRLHSVPCL